jgi:hydroxymethylbilane synthase
MKRLILGTRGSLLARTQSQWVVDRLIETGQVDEVELKIISTRGDRIQNVALAKIGGKGLFVKEIEQALLDGEIDFAVHSLKDVPAEQPGGLKLVSFPEREDSRDVLIVRSDLKDFQLSNDVKIGTGSLRRCAQLRSLWPEMELVPIRGNVGTRLEKLEGPHEPPLDAIVLAMSGLKRVGIGAGLNLLPLEPSEMVPAVGQGTLALECRENDKETQRLLALINHEPTQHTVAAERAFLIEVEGSCQIPLGAHAVVDGDVLALHGVIVSLDGKERVEDHVVGALSDGAEMGRKMAQSLLALGGRSILDRCLAEASV